MSEKYGPRYRNRIVPLVTGVYEQWTAATNPPGPPTKSYSSGTQNLAYSEEEIWDVVTKDFRKRVNVGEIINNPMTVKRYSYRCGGGSVIQDEQSGTKRHLYSAGNGSLIMTGITAGQVVYPTLTAFDKDKIVQQSKVNALANIEKVPYPFLEDLLELKETINFIRNPLSELADVSDAARNWRRRKYGRAFMSSADALSSAWLKYRFAVMPLVRSISQGMDAWSLGIPKPPPRQIARGKNSGSDAATSRYVAGTYNTYMTTATQNFVARSGIMYITTNPIDSWREALGLRFKDLPLGLWNIISLSFMLDRVWNVSSSIKALANLADPEVRILTGWVVTTDEQSKTATLEKQLIPGWSCSTNSDTYEEKSFYKHRLVWSPTVADALAPFNLPKASDLLPSDISSIADLCAIIQQRWR